MSLFSFADISISNIFNTTNNTSDLIGKRQYGYQILKYPLDIGDTDKGHYMVFHVNKQKMSSINSRDVGELPTVYENRMRNKNQGGLDLSVAGDLFNKLGETLSSGGITSSVSNWLGDSIGSFFGSSGGGGSINFNLSTLSKTMARTIVRTQDTVALYMPDSLAFSYSQHYSTPSLAGDKTAILAAGQALVDGYDKNNTMVNNTKDAVRNLGPFAAAYAANKSDSFTSALFTSVFGVVQNPMLEVIYSSPEFRTFRFDFFFYPRDEREALSVQKILERFRFHQAPEIYKQSNGFFLVPPSEFDIKFYCNGRENPNIPKISTCVLESIDLDYAPNGFASYEVPGESKPSIGRTGMPVAIRMSLQFKEAEYLTKDSFDQNLAGGES